MKSATPPSSEWRRWERRGWTATWFECPVCAAMVQMPEGVDKHKAWHDAVAETRHSDTGAGSADG